MTEHAMLPPLSSLMQQPAIHASMVPSEDNWKGKTSPAERRKIQNKLNQRTWRQRRKQEKQQQQRQGTAGSADTPSSSLSPVPPGDDDDDDDDVHATMQLCRPRLPSNGKDRRVCAVNATLAALTYLGRARPMIELQQEDIDDLYDLFLQRARDSRGRRRGGSDSGSGASSPGGGGGPDPMADSLLPLVQFNLFRGLMENSKTLGITLSMICDDDCVSPYGSDPAYAARAAAASAVPGGWAALPFALRPTRTQLTAAHHPWVDLLPLPRLRDNLIEAGAALDDDELCLDLIGNADAPSGRGGMILWGEPWDPRSWEVTEDFVEKWRWILEGCGEIIASSNYWRAKRGERRMRVTL
ncbi:hypothetical protein LZ30DRAFT_781748 [Colletotrichum cereale]|nr:hypothetical protein LZ30DRAFT_781748 [Colletotrichum cereale]